jgi:hypothetical protein
MGLRMHVRILTKRALKPSCALLRPDLGDRASTKPGGDPQFAHAMRDSVIGGGTMKQRIVFPAVTPTGTHSADDRNAVVIRTW